MTKKEDSSEIREFPRESIPVVFMNKPSHYEIITGDKFQEWERCLAEFVGLKVNATANIIYTKTRCYCDSLSPDDCDWI